MHQPSKIVLSTRFFTLLCIFGGEYFEICKIIFSSIQQQVVFVKITLNGGGMHASTLRKKTRGGVDQFTSEINIADDDDMKKM